MSQRFSLARIWKSLAVIGIPSIAFLFLPHASSPLQSPNLPEPVTPMLQKSSSAQPCMYTINTGSGGIFEDATIYDVNSSSGLVSGPVAVGIRDTIGLEMASDGYLYTAAIYDAGGFYDETGLYRIDPNSGAYTLVGNLGLGHFVLEGDLSFDPISGELYGIAKNGRLFTIDTATGLATLIGTVPSPNVTNFDFSYLSFDLAGNLYAVDNGFGTTADSYVIEVDPSTAASLGSVWTADLAHPGGMDVHPISGDLYLLETDPYSVGPGTFQLSILDPLTGARSVVGPLVLDQPYSGLAICEPAPPCTPPPPGMVAWWSYDEPLGLLGSFDLSDSDPNTGYLNGSSSVGGDLTLNGGYFEVADHSELDFEEFQDFSIDAWIETKHTSWNQTIVDKRAFSGGPGYLLTLYNGRLLLQLADAGGFSNYWDPGSTPLNDGLRHFIAVSVDRDQANGIKFYVDGNLVATHNPLGRPGSLANDSVLRVGAHSFAPTNRFYGNIDEVEIFNRVVAEVEFDAIYEAGSTGKCKPCMAETVLTAKSMATNSRAIVSDALILSNLRRLRDYRLSQTKTGQRFANLYAAYNMRVVWLMIRDRSLRAETATCLRTYHGTFLDLVYGRANYRVNQTMINDGRSWLNRVIQADQRYLGGSELSTAINREIQAIDWTTLQQWQVQDLLTYHD